MGNAHVILGAFQITCRGLGDGNAAVLAARAADGDRKLWLALRNIAGHDRIEQLLKLVGAKRSVAEIEEARAVKLVKNDVNRRVNAELANQTRSAGAAQHQLALIDELELRGLRDTLPDALAVFCDLRERYPDLSLRDLGEMADPPLSKSALYHRVLRLEKLIEANR